MPVLDNPRWEMFAQERAKGKTEVQAHELAGFSPDDGNASRLSARPEVQARIQELTGKAAERAVVTIASLLAELDEARALAFEVKQPAALVAATREKAVLSGNRIEQKLVGTAADWNDIGKLRDSIARDLKKLGIEDIPAAIAGGEKPTPREIN